MTNTITSRRQQESSISLALRRTEPKRLVELPLKVKQNDQENLQERKLEKLKVLKEPKEKIRDLHMKLFNMMHEKIIPAIVIDRHEKVRKVTLIKM